MKTIEQFKEDVVKCAQEFILHWRDDYRLFKKLEEAVEEFNIAITSSKSISTTMGILSSFKNTDPSAMESFAIAFLMHDVWHGVCNNNLLTPYDDLGEINWDWEKLSRFPSDTVTSVLRRLLKRYELGIQEVIVGRWTKYQDSTEFHQYRVSADLLESIRKQY